MMWTQWLDDSEIDRSHSMHTMIVIDFMYAFSSENQVRFQKYFCRKNDACCNESFLIVRPEFVVKVQATGGLMEWSRFSWFTLSGPFRTFKHHTDHIVDHWPSLYGQWTIFCWLPIEGLRSRSQSSDHLKLVSWTQWWVHWTWTSSTVTRSQSGRALTFGVWWSRRFLSWWVWS